MREYAPKELTKLVKPPRELARRVGTGKFQFVCMENKLGYPVGHCGERKCEHDTPEEASDCFRDWLTNNEPHGFQVDRAELFDYNTVLTFKNP